MSCRLQVYKDEKMKSLSFYQSFECNLLSEYLRLSKTEKQSIAELYLETNAFTMEELTDMFDCFPLLCQLYKKNTKFKMKDFYKNPFTVYKIEIDKLQLEGAHVKYCALALCVMFNNCVKEKWFTEDVDKNMKTIIKNTYEACKVVKGTSRLSLRDALDSLTHTFIRKDGEVYKTINGKLFDFIAFYFGSVMIYCLINNASSYFIKERFLFEEHGNRNEFMITVPAEYHQMYINRLKNDWLNGKVEDVFSNINMDNQIFRKKFLLHLKSLGISQQKQLVSLNDTQSNSSPLTQCCYHGDIDLVTWCLYHCSSNINHCRDRGESPLFFACQKGHIYVAQMLINNKADMNKCRDTGASPLFIACQEGHGKVVEMLIKNKADINKSKHIGASPLCIACKEGHTEVVQMLINNKADINQRTITGSSPLFTACMKGHIKVVQMLINNKADIDRGTDNEATPMYIACEKGHIEVVRLLINNKADANKCREKRTLRGLLINSKVDINKRRDDKASTLVTVFQEGYTEEVHRFINNKADMKECTIIGSSHPFNSYLLGHIKLEQMLRNYKGEIKECMCTKTSPLFIACQKGHTKVVQMLISNTADINKCKDIGESPL